MYIVHTNIYTSADRFVHVSEGHTLKESQEHAREQEGISNTRVAQQVRSTYGVGSGVIVRAGHPCKLLLNSERQTKM